MGISSTVLRLLLLAVTSIPVTPADTRREIDRLVGQLGHAEYSFRENATRLLRRHGADAEAALQTAAESDDPEIRARAREILLDIQWGVLDSWPPDLAREVRSAGDLPSQQRRELMKRVVDAVGPEACGFLMHCLGAADAAEARAAVDLLDGLDSPAVRREVISRLSSPRCPHEAEALARACLAEGGLEKLALAAGVEHLSGETRQRIIEKSVEKLLEFHSGKSFEELSIGASRMARAAPDEARLLYLEAEAREALGKPEIAAETREMARLLNPESEEPHFAAGTMLSELGREDLAEMEWLRILEIPPEGEVYDQNAHLRLGSIYAGRREFARAARAYEASLAAFRAARRGSGAYAMVGGSEEELERKIRSLRELAGEGAQSGLGIEVTIEVSVDEESGGIEMLRQFLGDAAVRFSLNVQPYGLRLLEEAPARLAYDPATDEVAVYLNESRCSEPIEIAAEKRTISLAACLLDYCYIFELDTVTGEMERLALFKKDYSISFSLGEALRALTDMTLRINEKEYTAEEVGEGIFFDYLPENLDIKVTGASTNGQARAYSFSVKPVEPDLSPAPDDDK